MKQPQLGIRITELRKQKGLTQEELVELCKINVRTLQRIESGEVTPRSYTVKTILSALDCDYESLQLESNQKMAQTITVKPEEVKSTQLLLIVAIVAGMLYLILGILEGFIDYFRFFEEELIFGIVGSVTIKAVSMMCYILMLYGFLIAGKLLRNYLMKIASVLLFFICCCCYLFDIVSFFNDALGFDMVILAEAITWGALGILFGISIMKSPKQMSPISYLAGGVEVLASLLLLTVVFSIAGLVLVFPAIILEVLFLYRVYTIIKKRTTT